MQKIWLVILCGIMCSIFVEKVIAQDSLANPTGQGSALTGTTPAAIENNSNGVQINNGTFNGTLTVPSCTSRICFFSLSRITPQGSEGIIGAIWNLGGSADEERAAADKLRVEMENTKNINDYKLQLLEKLGVAIDSGNSIRIRSIAIALAPLEGYKDFREYLKALLNENT
jgi:hypothetical protein